MKQHTGSPAGDALKKRLTPLQYQVTQEKGTEPAFTGTYYSTKDTGMYHCVVCGAELFSSDTKFDSGSGWPSFSEPTAYSKVDLRPDESHGMIRTEVICKQCGAHLGHVFNDGPTSTGQRYCINSCSLQFEKGDGVTA